MLVIGKARKDAVYTAECFAGWRGGLPLADAANGRALLAFLNTDAVNRRALPPFLNADAVIGRALWPYLNADAVNRRAFSPFLNAGVVNGRTPLFYLRRDAADGLAADSALSALLLLPTARLIPRYCCIFRVGAGRAVCRSRSWRTRWRRGHGRAGCRRRARGWCPRSGSPVPLQIR